MTYDFATFKTYSRSTLFHNLFPPPKRAVVGSLTNAVIVFNDWTPANRTARNRTCEKTRSSFQEGPLPSQPFVKFCAVHWQESEDFPKGNSISAGGIFR